MLDDKIVSSVMLNSNLQILQAASISEDRHFIESILDPIALKQVKTYMIDRKNGMRCGYYAMTPLQQMIYEQTQDCAYGFEGDHPWGIRIDSKGNYKVICMCEKASCARFAGCRPDVSKEEKEFMLQNELYYEQMEQQRNKSKTNRLVITESLSEESDLEEHQDEISSNEVKYDARDSIILSEELDTGEESSDDIEVEEMILSSDNGEIIADDIIEVEYVVDEPVQEAENEKSNVIYDSELNSNVKCLADFRKVSQAEYLSLSNEERVLVNAGPGTGKTWVLIQRLIKLLKDDNITPNCVLVMCYSRAAKAVVEARLQEAVEKYQLNLDWRDINIKTIDSFAWVVRHAVENEEEYSKEKFSLGSSYDENIKNAQKILEKKTELLNNIEYFMVDEIQDIVGIRARFLLRVLAMLPSNCGFTLLGDACQAIYDYSCRDEGDIDSVKLYSSLIGKNKNIKFLEFVENHRLSEHDLAVANGLREKLIEGNRDCISEYINALSNEIPSLDCDNIIDLYNHIGELIIDGNVAFFTRTNAEAVSLATKFIKNDIDVNLEIRNDYKTASYAAWLGRFFYTYSRQTIDEVSFKKHYREVFCEAVDDDIDAAWQCVEDVLETADDSYEVEEVLHRIASWRGNKNLIWKDKNNEKARITVSNIHRSKGMEYDCVGISDYMLEQHNEEKDEIIAKEEARVIYVSLSRAKKSIYTVPLMNEHNLYGWKIKKHKRYYTYRQVKKTTKRIRKQKAKESRLQRYEFISGLDIKAESFANETLQQRIINREIDCGSILKLQRIYSNNSDNIEYELLDDDGFIKLGNIENEFVRDFDKIYPASIKDKDFKGMRSEYYPQEFKDLFVNNVETYISTENPGNGAKRYGKIYIWLGVQVYGMASLHYDKQY